MDDKKLIKILIGIIVALVVVIVTIFVGSGVYQMISMQNKIKEMEKVQQEQEKKQLENQMMSIQSQNTPNNNNSNSNGNNNTKSSSSENTEKKSETLNKESNERLIVRKPIDVRKGSYCLNPSTSKSYFNTNTVYDPNADHPFMADIHFKDCIIYGTHSQGEYKGRHTGPITMTVSLAEERNFNAVMKRQKWYLENGEIMRINGRDYSNVYFSGWLMYKQTN